MRFVSYATIQPSFEKYTVAVTVNEIGQNAGLKCPSILQLLDYVRMGTKESDSENKQKQIIFYSKTHLDIICIIAKLGFTYVIKFWNSSQNNTQLKTANRWRIFPKNISLKCIVFKNRWALFCWDF